MTDWTECGYHRNYPTIELRVQADPTDAVDRRPMLFDTGSDRTYLADFVFPEKLRQQIESEGPWTLEDVSSPARPGGGRAATKSRRVSVEISDGETHLSGMANVTYVSDWAATPYARCGLAAACAGEAAHCDTRVGLVSTGLLAELQVEVALNGNQRTLSIRRGNATGNSGRRVGYSSDRRA